MVHFSTKFYEHFLFLIFQKFFFNYDTIENKKKAYNWASTNAVDYSEV